MKHPIHHHLCTLLTHIEHYHDSSRFFAKGPTGGSKLRLAEAEERQRYLSDMKALEQRIERDCKVIENKTGDRVTYRGK